jgi:uncharacterized damage-inducible protein DinB
VLPADISHLILCNISTLTVAQDILKRLPADKYNHVEKPYFESCLGKHLRHILDHYLCFIRDLESGTIDYEQRQRDSRLETNKEYTMGVIAQIKSQLECLLDVNKQGNSLQDSPLNVVLCNDVGFPQGEATQSSLRRELQFLQGHTVHHYALIATMLRFYGIDIARDFGVAPSTLVHEKTVKVSA